MERRIVTPVKVGNVLVGGEKIIIQSMLNIPDTDIQANVAQAQLLEKAGCDIVRVAVANMQAVELVKAIKKDVVIPLVADIHFDYKLALAAIDAGVDKIRINPGNIGDDSKVAQVVKACKAHNIPIRIGVNAGSLEKSILAKYQAPTAQALVESAMYHVALLEKHDFSDIIISIKSSNVLTNIEAYEILANKCSYPLHLGVTEAGTKNMGIIKNAIGIGSLLAKGIGDTIRVSLTADPVEEVYAAKNILKAIGLDNSGPQIVSCPTCGRTKIDLITLATKVEEALVNCDKNIKVAVMGCVVNGPGEAREADIGIAGGDGCAVLFKKGEVIRKIAEKDILHELLFEIEKL
ncbi:MAG: flavodoxin-dependent (E)-4-hydroxy-3-methylbut-2-enyl-diphosphate synthase [Oscillospiraceae bacterium]